MANTDAQKQSVWFHQNNLKCVAANFCNFTKERPLFLIFFSKTIEETVKT